uniref:Uncharacterized protein n=1 Tax=Synarthrophyton chejuense TaxID=2485825 RepID=A0A3G3MFK0_9FLOR|nr:hypothetical protein [Synarthrophyton chejuense]AYR05604.1 hypothetical protein [Synarthrophyton chejuense]
MFLFNMIFAHSFLNLPDSFLRYINNPIIISDYTHKKKDSILSSLPCLISNSDSSNIVLDNLANKNFLSGNFFTRLVNSFWYQKIYLSIPNKSSYKYIAELNSLDILKNKIGQKKFLSHFSKSLIDGSIQSSLSQRINDNEKNSSMIYIWKKYKIGFPLNLSNQMNESFKKNFKYLCNHSKVKSFPLFIVTNNLNQMVIAETPEESNYIYLNTQQKSVLKPYYQAWFFINFQDAEEYLNYISDQYNIPKKSNQLRLFICNLETFYKLSNQSIGSVQFRLVPDLNEVGRLVNIYSLSRNLTFNKNQKYGKDYFQGQPIYLLNQDKFLYEAIKKGKNNPYRPIFTNYETAVNAYMNLSNKDSDIKSFKLPNLIVYNLEDFLYEQVNKLDQSQIPFLLIPSKSSYEFTKNVQSQGMNNPIYNDIIISLSYLKLWTKRILWSLTSKQPQVL